MKYIDDQALERLRVAGDWPDATGTGYCLLERIASGGMGVIYKAEDEALGRCVAVKVLSAGVADSKPADRLIREARILAHLEHPGIVPVHDAGTLPDGRTFYVMKFVVGDRLDVHIESINSLSDRLRLFLRICDAVAFAHSRGVIHRDLKPENIMVGPFGEVLVMDWGLAKVGTAETDKSEGQFSAAATPKPSRNLFFPNSAITQDGTVLGTPGYMSPEQAKGQTERLDARGDIYSLGVVLRFLANKATPTREPASPRALRAIIAKAMAESQENRYPSIVEFVSDVSNYLEGRPVDAYRENLLEWSGRFYRRHQVAIFLFCTYLLMRTLFFLYPRSRP